MNVSRLRAHRATICDSNMHIEFQTYFGRTRSVNPEHSWPLAVRIHFFLLLEALTESVQLIGVAI